LNSTSGKLLRNPNGASSETCFQILPVETPAELSKDKPDSGAPKAGTAKKMHTIRINTGMQRLQSDSIIFVYRLWC
jgi:hypothetical protein